MTRSPNRSVTAAIIASVAALIVSPLPRVETWPLRVVAINVVQLGVVLLAGISWERWLSRASVFHLSAHVPWWAGGFIAYFLATFVFYWWHRWRHESDLL